MKRVDLIRTLESFGCVLVRQGAKHDWFRNPTTGVSQQVRAIAKSRSASRGASFACSAPTMIVKLDERTPQNRQPKPSAGAGNPAQWERRHSAR